MLQGLILLITISLQAHGAFLDGTLSKLRPNPELKTDRGQQYKLVSSTSQTIADLKSMDVGDYVALSGSIQAQGVFRVEQIEFIGIKKILGVWANRRQNKIFHFMDFKRLQRVNVDESTFQNSAYSLVPDEGRNRWTVFISNENGVNIGSITYRPNIISEIAWTLFDAQTGRPIETLYLEPLHLNP